MIQSYVFSEGKVVANNVDPDALKLVRADKGLNIWVDLLSPTPEESQLILEEVFNFHPLAIEDCLMVSQIPKVEDYEDYLFLVMHALDFSKQDRFLTSELNLFLGKDFLVSHHRDPLKSVQATWDRVQKNSLIMARSVDRLTYHLLDSLVDSYEPVLLELNHEIQEMEDEIFSGTHVETEVLKEFRVRRKEVETLRQIVRPQQDVVYRFARGEFKMIRPMLMPYLRDLHDNLSRIDKNASNFSEQLFLSMDVYLNKAAVETKEGVKILVLLNALVLPTILLSTIVRNASLLISSKITMALTACVLAATGGLLYWVKKKFWR